MLTENNECLERRQDLGAGCIKLSECYSAWQASILHYTEIEAQDRRQQAEGCRTGVLDNRPTHRLHEPVRHENQLKLRVTAPESGGLRSAAQRMAKMVLQIRAGLQLLQRSTSACIHAAGLLCPLPARNLPAPRTWWGGVALLFGLVPSPPPPALPSLGFLVCPCSHAASHYKCHLNMSRCVYLRSGSLRYLEAVPLSRFIMLSTGRNS